MRFTGQIATAVAFAGVCQAALKSGKDVFTPKDMLSLPRPAPAIASPDGRLGLSLVGQYAFDKKHNTKSLYVIPLDPKRAEKDEPVLLVQSNEITSIGEPLWLDENTVAYLNTTAGSSELYSISFNGSAHFESSGKQHHLPAPHHLPTPKHLHTFPIAPSSLKFKPLPRTGGKKDSHSTGVLAFSAHVWKGASIEETSRLDKAWDEREDEGHVWDELYIREWDTWRNPGKVHQVFLTLVDIPSLETPSSRSIRSHSTYLAPFNASSIYSLMQPFESGQFDVSLPAHKEGQEPTIDVIINVKDTHLNYAFHTTRQVYLTSVALEWKTLSLSGSYPYEGYQFSVSESSSDAGPTLLTSGDQAAVSECKFSPDGTKVAWLEMMEDGNESDRNRVVVYDLGERKKVVMTETWDRSPSAVTWALDGKSLYLIAENHGSALPYHLKQADRLPTPLFFNGSTASIQPLSNNTFLLGISTLTHPNEDYVLDISKTHPNAFRVEEPAIDPLPTLSDIKQITSWSRAGLKGKQLNEGEEFWFEGANAEQVMGWIVKPPGFREGDKGKVPAVMLIHGGPQGAWEDAWSTRWNPSVFAQQGYFVIAINPHGSTGYGQDFCDSIHSPRNDWGGKPYRDLVAGLQHVLDKYPAIDRDRLVAAGGSYGGYMVNWLQGHNAQTNFKAMVNHDGVFDMKTMYYSTEQVYFSEREGGGFTPYEDRAQYEDFNPINFVGEWSTPMLIVHGGQDFRIPDSQGIAAFTALQRRGIPSRLLYFAEENHWVLKPQNSLRWHTEVFKWFDEFVGEQSNASASMVIQA